MYGELAEDGADDVGIEDVGLRAFFGEAFDRLDHNTLASKSSESARVNYTFAREMDRKQTLMSMPLIVTCPSPNLMPSR